jgi:isopenicillin-N N-acyltransferase-like protein
MLKGIKKFIPYVESYSPETAEEAHGIADGSGLKYEEIMLLELHEERMFFSKFGRERLWHHCKNFGATGNATVDGECYVGQNWDSSLENYWDGAMPILLKKKTKSGPNVLAYAYPGLSAAAGMNSAGVAISWNSTLRVELKVGVPTYVLVAEMLRQKSTGEVLEFIAKVPRAGCFKFTVGDRFGEVCVVEVTPSDLNVIYVDDCIGYSGFFEAENIKGKIIKSEREALPMWWFISHKRINKLLKQKMGSIDKDVLFEVLSDHAEYPNSLCVHPDPDYNMKLLTYDAWVQIPKKGEWWIAHGPPCTNKPKLYTL